MDKKVDVDIAEKSLTLLNDFCSKLNDMVYRLDELEELTMDNMNNSLFVRSSSQSTKKIFHCLYNVLTIISLLLIVLLSNVAITKRIPYLIKKSIYLKH